MFTPSIALRDAPPSQNLAGGPFERAYKAFVVLGIGCGFVFFFSVVLYPNMARRELRIQLSKVFDGIGGIYHCIIQLNSTDSELPPTGPVSDAMAPVHSEASRLVSRLKKAEGHLQLSIVRLQPLLQFAALEPRLAGPFQADTYRKLVQLIQVMLDRLITARLCIGPTGFSKEVMRDLMGPTFEPRHLMHATIRNLLYIYSSALLSNKELPNLLPSAVNQREKLFTILFETLTKNQIDITGPNNRDLHTSGYLRVYAYHLSMRDFTNKMDEVAPLLKHLFGEQEELALLEAISGSDWSETSSIIEEELAEMVEQEGERIQGGARLENEVEQLA
ncbi:hypothetical protein BC937DRAFT_88758 [Endogone sp. FLAS-F59071]|nr:hypothetical protein BC937DRAFT_88758 [Endogone sp. FLAS-F59071]|eukprot:RUS18452.1 hypothetical protein BC937DRAFT_88758 [Endogone sp. FLAS-F59071]